jgi:hypothetical protein
MRGVACAILLLAVLSCPIFLAAEEEAEPAAKELSPVSKVYGELKKGDQVLVGFGKNITISGAVDKIHLNRLYVDLSKSAEGGYVGVFEIRKSDIRSLEKLPPLSEEKLNAIKQKMKDDLAKAYDAYKRSQEEERLRELEEEKLRAKAETETSVPRLTRRQLALLEAFPIEEGWGLAKYNDIRRRWLILDLVPTEQEREFTRVYDDWEAARQTFELYKKAIQEILKPEETKEREREQLEKIKEEIGSRATEEKSDEEIIKETVEEEETSESGEAAQEE